MIIFDQEMRLLSKSTPVRKYQTPKQLFICFILNLNELKMNGEQHKSHSKALISTEWRWEKVYRKLKEEIIVRKFGKQLNTAFIIHTTGMQQIQKWHASSCVARFY